MDEAVKEVINTVLEAMNEIEFIIDDDLYSIVRTYDDHWQTKSAPIIRYNTVIEAYYDLKERSARGEL